MFDRYCYRQFIGILDKGLRNQYQRYSEALR